MTKPLLIIQTGEAPDPIVERLGGFAQWFRTSMRLRPEQVRTTRVDAGGKLPKPKEIAGAVITGSGAMVTDHARWSEDTAAWMRTAMDVELPLFGVCYGHQLMAHALGGEVGWLPGDREIGTATITRSHPPGRGREIGTQAIARSGRGDAMFDGMPATFPAHTTHRQSVLVPPRGTRVLARSQADPHQILRYGPAALSTQFHPEFGVRAMRAYLHEREDILDEEDFDVAQLRREVRPTPEARGLLRRFAVDALATRG